MSINTSRGTGSVIAATVAVCLTSLLGYAFTSSTAHIRWLGSDAVTSGMAAQVGEAERSQRDA